MAFRVEAPEATLLATPNGLTVTTPGLDELQAAWLVMLIDEPSVKDPVAVICTDVPTAMELVADVTVIEVSVAVSTVSVAVPTCPANAAEMIVFPAATPVAKPGPLEAVLTVATDEAEEVQVAANVRSCVSPLANVPVALNWT